MSLDENGTYFTTDYGLLMVVGPTKVLLYEAVFMAVGRDETARRLELGSVANAQRDL